MSKNILLDAVKTAADIHKGDFSSLRGKSFVTCDNMKKKRNHHSGNHPMKKSRLDRIEESIAKLTQEMRDGFAELRQDIKDINARLDYNGLQIEQINKRLDYNNLKKLPESNK